MTTSFMSSNAGNMKNGVIGMFSFEDWSALNLVSQELVNPERNFPIVICVGLPLVTVCYLLVNIDAVF